MKIYLKSLFLALTVTIGILIISEIAFGAPTSTPVQNLIISDLKDSSNPHLIITGTGLVATSTAGGGGTFNATGTPQQILVFTGTSTALGYTTLTFTSSTNILKLTGDFQLSGLLSDTGGNNYIDADGYFTPKAASDLTNNKPAYRLKTNTAGGLYDFTQGGISSILLQTEPNTPIWSASQNGLLVGPFTTAGRNQASSTLHVVGNALITGQATSTNLSITGLAGASGCLSPDSTGKVVTSTCGGGGSATTTINEVNGPTFTFVGANDLVISTSVGQLTFTPLASSTWLKVANNLSDLNSTSSARTNIGFTAGNKITISALGAIGLTTSSISQFTNDSGYITGAPATTTIAGSGGTATGPAFTFVTSTASGVWNVTSSGATVRFILPSNVGFFTNDVPYVTSGTLWSNVVASSGLAHSAVTLTGENYLSLSGQQITANAIALGGTNVSGILSRANGGTGTSTAPTESQIFSANGSTPTWKDLIAGTNITISTSTTGITITGSGGGGSLSTSSAISINNFPFWTSVGGALSGTSTLTISGNVLTQAGALTVNNTSTFLGKILNSSSTVIGPMATYIVSSNPNQGDYQDIQSAVNALPSGGGKIFVRAGTYTLTSTIKIPISKVFIEGEGESTLIQADGNTVSPIVQASGTTISQFALRFVKILNSSTTAGGTGIDWTNLALSRLEGVRIEGFNLGLNLTDSANNTFYNVFKDVTFFDDNNCINIQGTQPNDNLFENIRCRPKSGGAGKGVYIEDARGENFVNLNIEPSSGAGIIGLHLSSSSREIAFGNVWIEGNATNTLIDAGAKRITFTGGTITAPVTTNISDGTDGTGVTYNNLNNNAALRNIFVSPLVVNGVVSSTGLTFVNATGTGNFQIATLTTTGQTSLASASTTSNFQVGGSFILNAEEFSDLTGTGLGLSGGALTNIGVTNFAAGRSLTTNNATGSITVDADAELYTFRPTIAIYDATTTSPYNAVRYKASVNMTLIHISCWSNTGTSTIQIDRRDEGSESSFGTMVSTSTACGTTLASSTSFATTTILADQYLTFTVSSTAGTPADTEIWFKYTKND